MSNDIASRRGFGTAPTERSGDGAFAWSEGFETGKCLRTCESGVALRLPPQYKMARFDFTISGLSKDTSMGNISP